MEIGQLQEIFHEKVLSQVRSLFSVYSLSVLSGDIFIYIPVCCRVYLKRFQFADFAVFGQIREN